MKCPLLMDNGAKQFYDSFADKYNLLVSDVRYDEDLPFFWGIFKKNSVKSILDCSCGTGKHVARFARSGFEAVGSDISPKMIRVARRNARECGIDASFVEADFKRLSEVFERKFDCVICWGNSLSHELEDRGVLSVLRSMYGVLNDKGVAVIQIRNLPKWVRRGKRIFPMHYHRGSNGDRKIFIYVLDFYKTKVTFNVISHLEFNGKPKLEVDSVDYRIISASRLKEMVVRAGFRRVKVYGNTELAKFSERQSEDMIVVGTK